MGPRTPRAKRVLDGLGDLTHIREWIAESCARENVAADSMGAALWEAAATSRIIDAQVSTAPTRGCAAMSTPIGSPTLRVPSPPYQAVWAR
jgi:hypothetical protein